MWCGGGSSVSGSVVISITAWSSLVLAMNVLSKPAPDT